MTDENARIRWRGFLLSKSKLKASSNTSALLSGFAMMSMVELQFDEDVPQGILIAYVTCASLLVSVHMLALMMSTCILPNFEAVSNFGDMVDRQWTLNESPHQKLRWYIEIAWMFSTGLGILLFMVMIALHAWLRFWKYRPVVPSIATAVVAPALVLFLVFAFLFYRELISYKYANATRMMNILNREMEAMQV